MVTYDLLTYLPLSYFLTYPPTSLLKYSPTHLFKYLSTYNPSTRPSTYLSIYSST